jgi:hypothetical protein
VLVSVDVNVVDSFAVKRDVQFCRLSCSMVILQDLFYNLRFVTSMEFRLLYTVIFTRNSIILRTKNGYYCLQFDIYLFIYKVFSPRNNCNYYMSNTNESNK